VVIDVMMEEVEEGGIAEGMAGVTGVGTEVGGVAEEEGDGGV